MTSLKGYTKLFGKIWILPLKTPPLTGSLTQVDLNIKSIKISSCDEYYWHFKGRKKADGSLSQIKKGQSSATGIGASIFIIIVVIIMIFHHLQSHHHSSYHDHWSSKRIWDRHQPSNGWMWTWNEDCAYIKTNDKWNDFSCTKERHWGWTLNPLCEKPIKRQPTIITTTKKPETNPNNRFNPTGDCQNKTKNSSKDRQAFSLRTLSDWPTS